MDELVTAILSGSVERDYLGMKPIPGYEEMVSSKDALRRTCSTLYRRDDISDICVDPIFRYGDNPIRRINAEFDDGEKSSFFIKKSWEGAILDALGMCLTNLLLKERFSFAVYNDTVAMNEIKGRTFNFITDEDFNEESAGNYGVALEFVNAFGMPDRNPCNEILTPDHDVAIIDFGHIFVFSQLYLPLEKMGDRLPPQRAAIVEGRRLGRQILRANLMAKRPLLERIVRIVRSRKAEVPELLDDREICWDCPLERAEIYLA